MSADFKNDLVNVLLSVTKAIDNTKQEYDKVKEENLEEYSEDMQSFIKRDLKQLNKEIIILESFKVVLSEHVKEIIESMIIGGAKEGELYVYDDYISYDSFYDEINDSNMDYIRAYLGM